LLLKKKDKPSIPILLNATYFTKDQRLRLNWNIADLGDADINEIYLELTDSKSINQSLSKQRNLVYFILKALNQHFEFAKTIKL
jgi:hypothetical protein